MPQQSSLHVYLEWTKQRINEMDATLASLETKAGQMSAASKVEGRAATRRAQEAARRVPGEGEGGRSSERSILAGESGSAGNAVGGL